MAKTFSVGKTIEFTAGEEADKTIYTVEAAKRLKLCKLVVAFPSGQAFKLQCYLKHGGLQALPDSGYLAGDGHEYQCVGEFIYDSGIDVLLHGKNTDTTTAQKVHVVIEGILE